MNVVLLEPSENDLGDAFDYYEKARHGLGDDFTDMFYRATEMIVAFPYGWQPLDAAYRRCRLKRFPFGVIYRMEEEAKQIVVVAVMHHLRHPDHWRSRL